MLVFCLPVLLIHMMKGSLNNATYLVDKTLGTSWTHEQHSPAQSVPVPVELLSVHGVKEVIKDSADIAVHPLQGNVKTQSRCLVHEGL